MVAFYPVPYDTDLSCCAAPAMLTKGSLAVRPSSSHPLTAESVDGNNIRLLNERIDGVSLQRRDQHRQTGIASSWVGSLGQRVRETQRQRDGRLGLKRLHAAYMHHVRCYAGIPDSIFPARLLPLPVLVRSIDGLRLPS